MEALSDFKTLQASIQQSLVAVTRSANQIASEDLGFHRSLDPSVATLLDKQNARLLGLTQRLLGNAAANTEVVGPQLPDFDSVDGSWKGIVDVLDSLLEKADTSLDEYTGAVKRLSPSGEQVRRSSLSGEAFNNSNPDTDTSGISIARRRRVTNQRYIKASIDISKCSYQRRKRAIQAVAEAKTLRDHSFRQIA